MRRKVLVLFAKLGKYIVKSSWSQIVFKSIIFISRGSKLIIVSKVQFEKKEPRKIGAKLNNQEKEPRFESRRSGTWSRDAEDLQNRMLKNAVGSSCLKHNQMSYSEMPVIQLKDIHPSCLSTK